MTHTSPATTTRPSPTRAGSPIAVGLVVGTYGSVEGLAQRAFVLGTYGWPVLLALAPVIASPRRPGSSAGG